jgi:phytol kinase
VTAALLRAAFVAGVFALILGAAELLRISAGAGTEWTRKMVHLLSGLVAAGFPWLFDGPGPVVGLALGYAALMVASRRGGWLTSVHAVRRRTRGGVLYPLAVALVFLLAGSHRHAYVGAILALAVGDAAAALVGRGLGRLRYRAFGASRSVEGSAAMALTVFPCLYLSLVLLTPMDAAACVAWSLAGAALATLVEAAAPGGSDNLLVPLATCGVLLAARPGGLVS